MTQKSQAALPGAVFALAAALFFGASMPLAKVFLAQVQPWMLAGLMFLGGGLGLAPIYLIAKLSRTPTASLKPGDLGWLAASILAGGVLAPVLLMFGLASSLASTASLLLNFEAVFTALLAWTVFRERWHWRVFLGIVAITSGGIVLSGAEHARDGLSWGALAILGACLTWALDSNFTNKIATRDPLQVAMLKNGVAGLINVAIALVIGQPLPSVTTVLGVCGVGFLCYGLTLFCFVLALRYLGSSRTGAYFALSPFVGMVIAAFALGEGFTKQSLVTAVLMALGVGLCLTEPNHGN